MHLSGVVIATFRCLLSLFSCLTCSHLGTAYLLRMKTLITGLLPPAVCVRALDVTVSQSSIQVARGQAAVLPCSFTTSAALNNLNIIWMVIPLSNANQPEQVQCTLLMHPLSHPHSDGAFLQQGSFENQCWIKGVLQN